MKIQELMTSDLATCDTTASLAEAVDVMRKRDCGFVPVLDPSSNALAGVLTDRDAVLAAAQKDQPLSEIDVTEAMAWEVFGCSPDDEVADVHELMQRHKVRRLPVMVGDNIVGIVSIADLARQALNEPWDEATSRGLLGQTMGVLAEPTPATH